MNEPAPRSSTGTTHATTTERKYQYFRSYSYTASHGPRPNYPLVVVRVMRRAMDKPLPLERSTVRNEPCRSPRLDPHRSRARTHARTPLGGQRAGLEYNARGTRACFGRELCRHMILQVLVSRRGSVLGRDRPRHRPPAAAAAAAAEEQHTARGEKEGGGQWGGQWEAQRRRRRQLGRRQQRAG